MHLLSSTLGLLAAVAAGGCDLDFNLDFGGPRIALGDDTHVVVIDGCSDTGLLACSAPAPGDTMSVTLDGQVVDVPPIGSDSFDFLPEYEFETQVPEPIDPTIEVDLGGVVQRVTLLPEFSITSPRTLSRSAGPVHIDWELLPGAETVAYVSNACGALPEEDIEIPTGSGTAQVTSAEVTFGGPGLTGDCTQTLTIEETVSTFGSGSIPVTQVKTMRVPIETTP